MCAIGSPFCIPKSGPVLAHRELDDALVADDVDGLSSTAS
jgi:hypothetical protein